jgi:hypothetical protein
MRGIGVLHDLDENDPLAKAETTLFMQGLDADV